MEHYTNGSQSRFNLLFNAALPHVGQYLVTALLFIFSTTLAYGQYQSVGYQFQDQPSVWDINASTTGVIPSGNILTTSSNGYGTWIATDASANWFLLGDNIATPATDIPTGIVDRGTMLWSGEPPQAKVATNLVGATRYVWPSADRKSFCIQGFNDDRAATPAERNIDISFTGMPYAANSREVVRGPIADYFTVSTALGGNDDKVSVANTDYRDAFDIAMDEKHLYIVWEVEATPNEHVNLMVVDLSTGQILPTFPRRVENARNRPTVDCDRRNSGDPDCRIATVKKSVGGNTLRYHRLSAGAITSHSLDYRYAVGATQIPYSFAKHARVVAGSARGTAVDVTAIYVLIEGDAVNFSSPTADEFIVYRFVGVPALLPALHIDGTQNIIHNNLQPGLQPQFQNVPVQVLNQHICAFANPYDGQATAAYDEFHGLYQLDLNVGAATLGRPLIIANGASTITKALVTKQRIGTGNNWQLTELPRPLVSGATSHYGSVNQKGIHLYWRSIDLANLERFHYSRDLRHLDEPIEENTLLTYINIVSNGTTSPNHQGTAGAQLLPDRRLTFWTDPNSSLYLPLTDPTKVSWHNCELLFEESGSVLQIGDAAVFGVSESMTEYLVEGNGAHVVTLPNYLIRFEAPCNQATFGQKLLFKGHSTWHFYGVPENADGKQMYGAGRIEFDGQGNPVSCDLISAPAPGSTSSATYVTIHGGASLVIPDAVTLWSDNVILDHEYEPEIKLASGTYVTGKIPVHGVCSLSRARVYSRYDPAHPNADHLVTHILILPPLIPGACTLPAEQINFSCVNYTNYPSTGTGRIIAGGNTSASASYRGIMIDAGIARRTIFEIQNPTSPITISDVAILEPSRTAIKITRPATDGLPYATVHITGNIIQDFVSHSMGVGSSFPNGILVENFNTLRSASFDKIFIADNEISSTSSPHPQYGIRLASSHGKVTGNSVSGISDNGIATFGQYEERMNSFFCNNTVSGCFSGIKTSNWFGYGMNNTVTASSIGHLFSGSIGSPNISLSLYEHNTGPGILVEGPFPVDLRGVDDGVYNHDGFTTIARNSQGVFPFGGPDYNCQVYLASGSRIIIGHPSSATVDGRNNLIRNNDMEGYFFADNPSGILDGVLDNNWWAIGSGDGTNDPLAAGDFGNIVDGNGNPLTIPTSQNTSFNTKPTIACGDGFAPLVVDFFEDTKITIDECLQLRDRVGVYMHTFKNRQAYDSSRYFLEHCFTIDNAWQDFQKATYSCDALSQEFNQHHWPDYVEWLESVLYLREDSIWYCSDVSAIASAMTHVDSTKDRDYRSAISVLKYLVDSVDCGFLNIHIKNAYDAAIESQLYIWRDSVQDSSATPPDTTTLFTLDELGLTSLRDHHSDVSESDIIGAGLITDLSASPNPSQDESRLHFTLSDAAMVKLEVFDALGKRILTESLGWHAAGASSHAVDMRAWPSGTYYARISSLRGEVRSVMVVKEQ